MQNASILKEIIVQILGFAVVFFVLKKLAWTKLLGAIDARKKSIENQFLDIEERNKRLEALEKSYRQKLENIEEEARAKIQEASKIGVELARDIQEKARLESSRMVERAKLEIEQDLQKTKMQMRDEIVEISGLMAEKVIRQKLDAKEHERLVTQFIQDLEKV